MRSMRSARDLPLGDLRCDVNLCIKTLDLRWVRSDGVTCQEVCTCRSALLAEVTRGSLLLDPLSFSFSESSSSTETALGSDQAPFCAKLVQDHRTVMVIIIKSSHDHKPWKPKLFCLKLCKRTSISLILVIFSVRLATFPGYCPLGCMCVHVHSSASQKTHKYERVQNLNDFILVCCFCGCKILWRHEQSRVE